MEVIDGSGSTVGGSDAARETALGDDTDQTSSPDRTPRSAELPRSPTRHVTVAVVRHAERADDQTAFDAWGTSEADRRKGGEDPGAGNKDYLDGPGVY
eukprot:g30153.t1